MRIKDLLYSEKKWARGALARDKQGKPINNLDQKHLDGGRTTLDFAKNATSWSLPGAIATCYNYDDHDMVLDKLHTAMKNIFKKDMYIAKFNDAESTTFGDVRKLIVEAGV